MGNVRTEVGKVFKYLLLGILITVGMCSFVSVWHRLTENAKCSDTKKSVHNFVLFISSAVAFHNSASGVIPSNASCVGVYQSNTLCRVFMPRLCHSGQSHRFTHCSSSAVGVGALECPKKNSRNGNKEELYFTFTIAAEHFYYRPCRHAELTRTTCLFLCTFIVVQPIQTQINKHANTCYKIWIAQ